MNLHDLKILKWESNDFDLIAILTVDVYQMNNMEW